MSAPTTVLARLEAFKTQKQQRPREPALRSPPSLSAVSESRDASAGPEPAILRAQQFLAQSTAVRVAEPAAPPAPQPESEPAEQPQPESGVARGRQQLSVELARDQRGFGIEYTVTADARLVVVSCSCRPAAGQSSPTPGLEIVAVDGQVVKGNAEALYAALDAIAGK